MWNKSNINKYKFCWSQNFFLFIFTLLSFSSPATTRKRWSECAQEEEDKFFSFTFWLCFLCVVVCRYSICYFWIKFMHYFSYSRFTSTKKFPFRNKHKSVKHFWRFISQLNASVHWKWYWQDQHRTEEQAAKVKAVLMFIWNDEGKKRNTNCVESKEGIVKVTISYGRTSPSIDFLSENRNMNSVIH